MAIAAFPINAAAGVPAYTAQQFRQALAALLSPGASGLRVQPGVRPGPGLDVTVSGSTITITAGVCVAQGGSSTVQGPYLLHSDASVTRTLTAANATNPRIDLVYARVRDTDADASGARDGDIIYLAGAAAASPAAPTPTDATYTVLATIAVPRSGNGNPAVSYASRAYTAAVGGITVGAVAPPSPHLGQQWDSGDGPRRWDGTQWRYLSLQPQVSRQLQNLTAYSPTQTWVDFTAAQWAPLTFVVPPSGAAFISIGGTVQNTATTASTAWMGWRASGGYTQAAGDSTALSCWGSRVYATRRTLVNGMTPGASVTLTAAWNVSSVGVVGSTTRTMNGEITVEPVA
ncbi:hypothetical protein [Streptomyces sp. NPDC091212]|uniref:hypothetical protein n=1 Tax=Streptomyces sp. NPDC091212 TaxID=3155191 RepID=UPI00343017AD